MWGTGRKRLRRATSGGFACETIGIMEEGMFEHATQSTWEPDWWFISFVIIAIFILAFIVSLLIELVEERRWKSLCILGSFSAAVMGLLTVGVSTIF